MEHLTEAHFDVVVKQIKNQVFGSGKGAQRHGLNDTPLEEQTWAFICKTTGTNSFCVGQAIKKATELKAKPDKESYDIEILGAIIYLIFAKMWKDKESTDIEVADFSKIERRLLKKDDPMKIINEEVGISPLDDFPPYNRSGKYDPENVLKANTPGNQFIDFIEKGKNTLKSGTITGRLEGKKGQKTSKNGIKYTTTYDKDCHNPYEYWGNPNKNKDNFPC